MISPDAIIDIAQRPTTSISPETLEWVIGVAGVSFGFLASRSVGFKESFQTSVIMALIAAGCIGLARAGMLDPIMARYFAISAISFGIGAAFAITSRGFV